MLRSVLAEILGVLIPSYTASTILNNYGIPYVRGRYLDQPKLVGSSLSEAFITGMREGENKFTSQGRGALRVPRS